MLEVTDPLEKKDELGKKGLEGLKALQPLTPTVLFSCPLNLMFVFPLGSRGLKCGFLSKSPGTGSRGVLGLGCPGWCQWSSCRCGDAQPDVQAGGAHRDLLHTHIG